MNPVSKYTPGLWVAQKSDWKLYNERPWFVYSSMRSTWDGYKYTDDPVASMVRTEADARLIAAAPLLLSVLAALEGACDSIELEWGEEDVAAERDLIKRVKVVLGDAFE